MYRLDNEEEVKKLMQEACKPVQIPQDFKSRLRDRLVSDMVTGEKSKVRSFWSRPKIVIPLMASVTGGLIGYGAWVSLNLVPAMLP